MKSDKDKRHSENLNKEIKSSLKFTKTTTDHIAVSIIQVLGSMGFLIVCLFLFTIWITWNLHFLPGLKPFDPFPFPILTMVVSLFAIVLSISVLINQNRQGRMEKIRQQVEFEVNVRAENEITKVLTMLHEIHQKLGLDTKMDKELEEMKEPINIDELQQALDSKAPKNP